MAPQVRTKFVVTPHTVAVPVQDTPLRVRVVEPEAQAQFAPLENVAVSRDGKYPPQHPPLDDDELANDELELDDNELADDEDDLDEDEDDLVEQHELPE